VIIARRHRTKSSHEVIPSEVRDAAIVALVGVPRLRAFGAALGMTKRASRNLNNVASEPSSEHLVHESISFMRASRS